MKPIVRFETAAEAWEHLPIVRFETDAEARLERLCNNVNNPSRWRPKAGIERFKKWVAVWRSAPSVKAAADALGISHELDGFFHADPALSDKTRHVEVRLRVGRDWQTQHPYDPDEVTLELFAELIANPMCEKFGGPCPKCEKYFVKQRRRQVYCSRKCHSAATAKKATEERNTRIRGKKIEYVETAKRKYDQLRRKPIEPWKRWVAKAATELMLHPPQHPTHPHPYTKHERKITSRFITENKIKPPKGAK
jgi:hypothetical protein